MAAAVVDAAVVARALRRLHGAGATPRAAAAPPISQRAAAGPGAPSHARPPFASSWLRAAPRGAGGGEGGAAAAEVPHWLAAAEHGDEVDGEAVVISAVEPAGAESLGDHAAAARRVAATLRVVGLELIGLSSSAKSRLRTELQAEMKIEPS